MCVDKELADRSSTGGQSDGVIALAWHAKHAMCPPLQTPCIPVPLEGIIDFILMIYDNDFANEMSSSDADGSSGIPISYTHPLLSPVSTLFGCL